MKSQLTLVLGGVSSGKSVHAERISVTVGKRRVYIATAQSFDAEMAAKIDIHQSRRGKGWSTVEAPFDLANALATPDGDVVLIDCLSMWLTNHLLADHDTAPLIADLLGAIAACPVPLIAVSNEVGLGGIEANPLARKFAIEQGRLNQKLAEISENVHLVVAGLATPLKGNL